MTAPVQHELETELRRTIDAHTVMAATGRPPSRRQQLQLAAQVLELAAFRMESEGDPVAAAVLVDCLVEVEWQELETSQPTEAPAGKAERNGCASRLAARYGWEIEVSAER